MSLNQLVAVRNTLHESLEVTRWINVSESNVEQVEKEMMALVDRFYPKLSGKDKKKQEKTVIAVGILSEVLDVPRDKVKNLTKKIHYALYEGHCLDPEKLSYFVPEKTIDEGELTLEEVKKILKQ
jgi:hypothetical protein